MTNLIRKTHVKTMTVAVLVKKKATEFSVRAKNALTNREGQGTLDVAIFCVED
jgi:hypothetical protein